MPTIHYQKRAVGKDLTPHEAFFFVEIEKDSQELLTLEAAFRATYRSHFPSGKENRQTFVPMLENVMALWASGFEWELEAAKEAMNILASAIKEAMHSEIIEPPRRMFS